MLAVPVFWQRDSRWKDQRLGTKDGTTLGGYGCAVTSVTMVDGAFDPGNPWNPSQVDDWFTEKGGYVDGGDLRSPQAGCNLLDWSAIDRLLPNTHWHGADYTLSVPADLNKIRAHLDGGGLVIFQVGFGGDPNAMHFVTGVDYAGDDIIFNDPWYGDRSSFASKRYGSGASERDILVTHFFSDRTPPTPPPPAPPSPLPETPPAPVEPTPEPAPQLDKVELIYGYLSRYKSFKKYEAKQGKK